MEQQATAPPEVRNVVNFLRSSKAGIKVRVGVLNGKRIDYFKGVSPHVSCLITVVHRPPHTPPRQIRCQSTAVPRLRQTQKRTKARVRRRSREIPALNHPLRILSTSRSWSAIGLVIILTETPANKPGPVVPIRGVLCLVL